MYVMIERCSNMSTAEASRAKSRLQRRRVIENHEIDVVAAKLLDCDRSQSQFVAETDPLPNQHGDIDIAVMPRLSGCGRAEKINRLYARVLAQAPAEVLKVMHAAIIAEQSRATVTLGRRLCHTAAPIRGRSQSPFPSTRTPSRTMTMAVFV